MSMEALLRRVRKIEEATSGDRKDDPEANVDPQWDEFTRMRQQIASDVRKCRDLIKARDDSQCVMMSEDTRADLVAQNVRISQAIHAMRAQAAALRQQALTLNKKAKQGAESSQKRLNLCDLVDAHIDECEAWLKKVKFSDPVGDRRALLKGANLSAAPMQLEVRSAPGNAGETNLEEIDGVQEWMLQIRENEAIFEEKLDQAAVLAETLKMQAQQIKTEQDVAMAMERDVEAHMDRVEAKVGDALVAVEETKKKLATKKNCCMDIVLILIFLGLIFYILWKYVF